ncbi:MAG: MBOAT family protein [Vicinamibacteraceae bacterium]
MPAAWPRWLVMWTLAGAIYAACKVVTSIAAQRAGVHAAWWRHAGYLLAWPGMDATAFLAAPPPAPPAPAEWAAAAAKLVAGATLLVGLGQLPADSPSWVLGWLGMLALILLLHFGVFHVLSCAWRQVGVDARPLMAAPLRAVSVAEFWGRRWNTAYRDLTHRFLFRPLRPRLGLAPAIIAGFVCSGLVHDLVISVPAGGGYGGPTGFFTVQGLALLGERSAAGRRVGLGHGVRGRIFTIAMLVVPLPALFHPPFVERIVVPFLSALGAI